MLPFLFFASLQVCVGERRYKGYTDSPTGWLPNQAQAQAETPSPLKGRKQPRACSCLHTERMIFNNVLLGLGIKTSLFIQYMPQFLSLIVNHLIWRKKLSLHTEKIALTQGNDMSPDWDNAKYFWLVLSYLMWKQHQRVSEEILF